MSDNSTKFLEDFLNEIFVLIRDISKELFKVIVILFKRVFLLDLKSLMAQLMDSSGVDKETKAILDKIAYCIAIATLVKTARATGIHLVLGA